MNAFAKTTHKVSALKRLKTAIQQAEERGYKLGQKETLDRVLTFAQMGELEETLKRPDYDESKKALQQTWNQVANWADAQLQGQDTAWKYSNEFPRPAAKLD